jgi:hypothetical protein
MKKRFELLGHEYHVVRSLEDVQKVIHTLTWQYIYYEYTESIPVTRNKICHI